MTTLPSSSPGGIIRFGVFEADLSAGELRKSGRRIRLQEQPFQMLVLLLDHPGEVVTREDVRQKLWHADTFVDFDHSLNTAINKVREALGDSASSPRYVETIARRGYRFVAPVERVPDALAAGQAKEKEPSSNKTEDATSIRTGDAQLPLAPAVHPELQIPLPKRGLTRGLFALIQVMYLAFYVVALFLLGDLDLVTQSFLPWWGSTALEAAVIATAGIGIPLRLYLLSAAAFDHRHLGEKFPRMFPYILVLDELWAIAPFLTAQELGFGAAFAATAALLYVPFAERTLVKMAYHQLTEYV
jgi:cholera toxin transcriptional activator